MKKTLIISLVSSAILLCACAATLKYGTYSYRFIYRGIGYGGVDFVIRSDSTFERHRWTDVVKAFRPATASFRNTPVCLSQSKRKSEYTTTSTPRSTASRIRGIRLSCSIAWIDIKGDTISNLFLASLKACRNKPVCSSNVDKRSAGW